MFLLLLIRLWYLQLVEADSFKDLSESNRLRIVPVAASRGTIFDRNGKILVSNRPSFTVAAIPQEVKDKETLFDRLARLLGIQRAELTEKWEKGKGRAKYHPVILASSITRDQLEILEENRPGLPGVDVQMHPVREYPHGTMAAHLLGSLGEMSEKEMASELFEQYNPGDYVGKSGLERAWERELHGANGGRQLEVDAMGRVLRTVSEVNPSVGNSLVLTIDLDIQKSTEEAFGEQAGAAVAMDINTGEILAFVSKPDFDPALFAGRLPQQQWNDYLADVRHPLENKALKGQYPPGSTFKIITALAGLEEGLIDLNSTVDCKGSYVMGNKKFNCWNRRGHGVVNLKKALRESCDVYFYTLGERLGVDKIAYYAKKFGMGAPMGIGLESEKSGLIPTMGWKEMKYKKKWLRGETIPVSIGQGYVLMTPIQLVSMISTVANEGTVFRPYLVKRIINQEGKTLKAFKPEVITRTGIKAQSYRLVKEGLLAVVNEPGGTGGVARLSEVKVAGKTGTSQVVKLSEKRGPAPYKYRDHALFVAFAPFENPEIAVAVVVEHGEHGGSAAAPIAARMLRKYFEGKGAVRKSVRGGGRMHSGTDDETPKSEVVTPEQEPVEDYGVKHD
jgi:penicillin-binding protein 2